MLQAFLADKKRIGWRAYAAVYPKSSQRAAETAWSRLLTNAEFKFRHDELLGAVAAAVSAHIAASTIMDLDEVLGELSKLGRSSIKNVVVRGDDTADVIQSLQDMRDEDAAAIQELTIETYVEGAGESARDVKRVKIKLHDKRGALSELRRHHEPNKHEIAGAGGGPIQTEDVTPASPLDLARRIAFALELGARAPAPAPAAQAKPKPKAKKRKKAK